MKPRLKYNANRDANIGNAYITYNKLKRKYRPHYLENHSKYVG